MENANNNSVGNFYIGNKTMQVVAQEKDANFKGFEDGEKISSKHIKVLVQNLLSLKHVAVLSGAGTSIHVKGPSLRKIPIEIEKVFLKKAIDMKDKSAFLFYAVLYHIITGEGRDLNAACHPLPALNITSQQAEANLTTRLEKINNTAVEKYPTIAIDCNFEKFLSFLELFKCKESVGQVDTPLKFELTLSNWCNSESPYAIAEKNIHELLAISKFFLMKLTSIPFSKEHIEYNGMTHNPLFWHRIFMRKLLTRDPLLPRVNLFTLNYDLLFELAMDSLGIMYFDGFVGLQNRAYRPESFDMDFYSPADKYSGKVDKVRRVCRYFKLHGSISWHSVDKSSDNLYGIVSKPVSVFKKVDLESIKTDDRAESDNLIIYPIPQKDSETILGQPYADMFRHLRHSISQAQTALFILGYGFGDPHVNDIIFQALSNPSFTVFIVNPSLPEDLLRKIKEAKDTRIYALDGKVGEFQNYVENYMPDVEEEEILQKIVDTLKTFYDTKE